MVQAIKAFPNMNRHYAEVDGKPTAVTPAHTNLGLAIDLQGKDGKRSLVVAGIKRWETMRFAQFVTAYEDIVRRARDGERTCRPSWIAFGSDAVDRHRLTSGARSGREDPAATFRRPLQLRRLARSKPVWFDKRGQPTGASSPAKAWSGD